MLSMNFDQTGNVTACCFNRTFVLGKYPEQSVAEIWAGKSAEALRRAMEENSFDLGCQQCEKMIGEGNEESVLIKHFDDYYEFLPPQKKETSLLRRIFNFSPQPELPPPTVFEFEISNTCNLECIMCGGKWSSAIRANRERLPVIKSPYDENFVSQVRGFLPSLKRANFLGGEPFLISLYFDIWESIIAINPSVDVAITSNGTVINDRAKKIIDRLPKCRITLSIDSLQKSTWEKIRVNGNFETLRKNIDYLLGTGKLVSFSVCPMIQNRMEIPEIIAFCVDHNLDIFFNIVHEPLGGRVAGIHQSANEELKHDTNRQHLIPETSLMFLSSKELNDLINYYQTFKFSGRPQVQFNSLIQNLKSWQKAQTTAC